METDAWFDESFAWLPGTVWGVLIGIFGGVCGVLSGIFRQSKTAIEVLRCGYWIFLSGSVGFLIAGMIAWITGQPYGVWHGLSLPGLIGLAVLICNSRLSKRARDSPEIRI